MKVDTKELFLNGKLFMVLMKYLRKKGFSGLMFGNLV